MRNVLVFVAALGALSLGGLSLTGCDDGGSGGAGASGGTGGAGGSGGEGGSGGGAPTLEGACASLAKALCSHIETCAPFVFKATYGDPTTCQQRSVARCVDAPSIDGSNVTPASVQACGEAYAARTCDDIFAGVPAVCRVPGDRADGAPCAAPGQCAGLLCETPAEGQCGTCATQLHDGDGCNPAADRCETGLFCDDTSSTCRKYSALNEPCSAEAPCKAGLSCNNAVCGAALQDGADCSQGKACDIKVGAFCSLDSTCHTFQLAKLGQACGFDQATYDITLCEADAKCSEAKVCVARPKAGEACVVDPDSGDGNCIAGLDCVGGTCQAAFPVCN
jgi:hypothetical protein